MSNTLVPEADRANLLRMAETWAGRQVETIGDKPRSIRKRGFWRAYRGGALLILVDLATRRLMGDLEADLYGNKFESSPHVMSGLCYLLYPPKNL